MNQTSLLSCTSQWLRVNRDCFNWTLVANKTGESKSGETWNVINVEGKADCFEIPSGILSLVWLTEVPWNV